MTIEYREFLEADLSKIKEFTEVMPTYYENWNDHAPMLLADKNSVFYGAFEEEKIIGLGNLRRKTKEVAWIELIRVRPDNQQIGVGTELFQFGDETAKKLNYKIVGYATEGGNKGSCKIGEKLGFKLLTKMFPFRAQTSDPVTIKTDEPSKSISIDEALILLQEIPDAPKDYLAIGWDFAPLVKSFFENEPHMTFYVKNKTILLQYLEHDEASGKVSWMKAIVYGAEEDAEYLLSEFVNRTKDLGEYFTCITTARLEHIVEKMKFTPSKSEDGRRNTIVMWEKKIKK